MYQILSPDMADEIHFPFQTFAHLWESHCLSTGQEFSGADQAKEHLIKVQDAYDSSNSSQPKTDDTASPIPVTSEYTPDFDH